MRDVFSIRALKDHILHQPIQRWSHHPEIQLDTLPGVPHLEGSSLESLPYSIGLLRSLATLNLTHCLELQPLPVSIKRLPQHAKIMLPMQVTNDK